MANTRWSIAVGAGAIAVLCACGTPVQHKAELRAEPRAGFTRQQLAAVFREAAYTHDGFVYAVDVARLPNCAEAEKLLARLDTPPNRLRPLRQVTATQRYADRYLFAMEPELREQLRVMEPSERTGAVKAAGGECLVAQIVERKQQAMASFEQVSLEVPYLVERGFLPHPDALENDPLLRTRTVANGVRTVDAARAVPPGFDFNTRMSNDHTVLTIALLTGRVDLAREALTRGANPNLCGPKLCPLQLALMTKDQAQAWEALELLLQSGADPNQLDLPRHADVLPLGAAAGRGRQWMERLVKAGAKVNGVPQVTPPLFFAAAAGDRDAVDYLAAQGASVLARDNTVRGPSRTLYDAARASKSPQFVAWIEKCMLDAAANSGQYKSESWLEQDGKRITAVRGEFRLKPAPFRIVTRLPKGVPGVTVASGQSPAFQDDVRSLNRESAVFRPSSVGAEGNGDTSLYVLGPSVPTKNAVIQYWFWLKEDLRRFTGRREAGDAIEFFKDIRAFDVARNGDRPEEVALADYRGGDVHLVIGVPVYLSMFEQRFVEPQFLRLRFQ